MTETAESDTDPGERFDRLARDYVAYEKARRNPINRETFFAAYHHTNYSNPELQQSIKECVEKIQTTHQDHALMVGGDRLYRREELHKEVVHFVVEYTGDGFLAQVDPVAPDSCGLGCYLETEDELLEFFDQLFIPEGGVEEHESFVACGLLSLDQTVFRRFESEYNPEEDIHEQVVDDDFPGFVASLPAPPTIQNQI